MSRELWRSVQRVLVACPGGDDRLASAVPALRLLRQALPTAKICLWTPTCNTEIAERLPGVNELLLSPVAWTGTLMPLITAIRNRAFDAAIMLTGPEESPYPAAYICYLAGIPIRIGQSAEFGGSVLSRWIKPSPGAVTMEEYHLHLMHAAGLQSPGAAQFRDWHAKPATATAITAVPGENQ